LEENLPGGSLFLKTTNGYQQLTGGSCGSEDVVVYAQESNCNGVAVMAAG